MSINHNLNDRTISELENLDIDSIMDDQPSRVDQILWRIAFCLLCLLFIWITSATVTSALIGMAVPTPTVDQTVDRWQTLFDAGLVQVNESEKCANNSFLRCTAQSDIALEQFKQKIQEIVIEEQDAFHISSQLLQTCTDQYNQVIHQFDWHLSQGFQVFYDASCTDEEILQVKKAIGDSDSLLNLNLDVVRAQQEQWRLKMESFGIDSVHDVDYKNQFQSLSDLSLSDALNDVDQTYDNLTALGQNLSNSINFPTSSFNMTFPDAFSFTSAFPIPSVVAQYSSIAIQGLEVMKNSWRKVNSDIKKLGLGEMPSIDELIPSNVISLSIFQGILQSLLASATNDVTLNLQAGMQHVRAKLSNSLNSVANQIEDGAVKMSSMLTLFDDYDPPPLNFNATIIESINLNLTVPTFQDWTFDITTKTREAKQEAKNVAESIISLFRSIPEKLSSIQLPRLDSVDWAVGKVTNAIQPTINLINTLWKILVIYDIVYRVTASLKTIFFYGKATFSQLPVLDLRQSENQGSLLDKISKLPMTMLGPAALVVVLVAFILTLTIIVVVQYVKMYESYVNGCVTSKDGTFLTINTQHVASNLLNDTTIAGMLGYEQRYTESTYTNCQQVTSEGQSTLSQANYQLTFQKSEFHGLNLDLTLIRKCINPNLTYTFLNPSLSNPGPFLQIDSSNVANAALINGQVVDSILRDSCPQQWLTQYPWTENQLSMGSTTSCMSMVPSCDIQTQCSPSYIALNIAAHYSGCDSEWHLHSTVIKLFLTILVMICLNVARILVMKFLVTWFFRELGTINVEVLLNYRFRTMQCSLSQAKIQEKIQNLIKKHKRKALIYLAGAVVCQIPYLFAIFWFLNFTSPMR